MSHFRIKNWNKYQHYGDNKKVPWIKLHYEILTGEDFSEWNNDSKLLAIVCMLIASRHEGTVPNNPKHIQRVGGLDKIPDFKPLIGSGFLEVEGCQNLSRQSLETVKDLESDSLSYSISESLSKGGVGEKSKPPPLPDYIPKSDWDDFVASRKNKITPRAAELIFKKLDEFRTRGDPPGEVLQQSIQNGWTGIFPLKRGQNDKRSSTSPHQPSNAATEARRRGIADALARRVETSGRTTTETTARNSKPDSSAGNGFIAMHGSSGSGLSGEIIIPLRNPGELGISAIGR